MSNIIFILGAPRSGTTLIKRMLVKKQKYLGGADQESAFYNKICKKKYKLETYLDSNYFTLLFNKQELEDIYERSIGHIDFFKNAIAYYLDRDGKFFFAEKTPQHTLYFNEILINFENPIILLIERNPAATIHSMVVTPWVGLFSDKLPGILRQRKFIRYIAGSLQYYRYYRQFSKIRQYENTICIRYEDIIKGLTNVKELLERNLNIPLNDLFISRPFSPEVKHRRQGFDLKRINGYRKVMPGYAQLMASFLFEPDKNSSGYVRWLFITYLLEPISRLKTRIMRNNNN